MPTVTFEAKGKKPLTVAAPDGGSLADLCDDTNAPIPFSCRSANCGTCRIEVMQGQDELLEPNDEELDVLDIFALAPPKYRLACQAQMRAGQGALHVRSIEDEE